MKCSYANFQAVYQATLDLEIMHQDYETAKPVMVATMEDGASTSEFA